MSNTQPGAASTKHTTPIRAAAACFSPIHYCSSAHAGASFDLRIGQHARHRDYKGERVTGIVQRLSVEPGEGLMVEIFLDAPIVIPASQDCREIKIYRQYAPAHEFQPFDERDDLIAELRAACGRASPPALTPPAPGQYWLEQSAWYAGPVAYPDGRVIALLLPDGQESLGTMRWGKYGQDVPGAKSHHDGHANTAAMAAAGSPAAQAVLALNAEWHMPSQIEALQLYATLKEQVGAEWTWTSTQNSSDGAFVQGFEHGRSGWYGKGDACRVRAVRGLTLRHFNTSAEGGAS